MTTIICENINGPGSQKGCAFLRSRDGFYSCGLAGFRYRGVTASGVSKRNGFSVYYDRDLLRAVKAGHGNFCAFRLFAPLILIAAGLGWLLKSVAAEWVKRLFQ